MKKIGRAFANVISDGVFGCMGIVFLSFLVILIFSLPTIWHESHVWGFIVFASFIVPFINGLINNK